MMLVITASAVINYTPQVAHFPNPGFSADSVANDILRRSLLTIITSSFLHSKRAQGGSGFSLVLVDGSVTNSKNISSWQIMHVCAGDVCDTNSMTDRGIQYQHLSKKVKKIYRTKRWDLGENRPFLCQSHTMVFPIRQPRSIQFDIALT